ncbi:MAG: hypothetical protein WD669_10640 [Pirellulales bacterium]
MSSQSHNLDSPVAVTGRPSLQDVCTSPESPDDFDIGKALCCLDIAEVNLACAKGLPGTEEIDFDDCLEKIDEWADKVRHATSRNYNWFLRNPSQFDNSLGKFYMGVLCTTLQTECGVGYNPQLKMNPGDARDSRDRFIHGITHGAGGTCASLPVLYIAVGRRLGYPLRLARGVRHLFLRWDDSESESPLVRDRFNIEATASGFVSPPDPYYEESLFAQPVPGFDTFGYLRSLTPREELAEFLCIRSIVLMDNGKFAQAVQPAAWARQLMPDDYSTQVHLEITMLLALGILDEKPPWVDADPIISHDGVAWSRHWWPRPMENRELLPAAKLPRDILSRILPMEGPDYKPGDLADALYERANHYADQECVERAHRAAMSQRSAATAAYLNTIQRARQREMIDAMTRNNNTVGAQGGFRDLAAALPPAVRQALPPEHPLRIPRQEHFGVPHHHGGTNISGAFAPPGIAPHEPMLPELPSAVSDAQFAMTHGIFPMPEVGSLFEYMGTPKELVYQPQTAAAIPRV